jgi:hypothetical protein
LVFDLEGGMSDYHKLVRLHGRDMARTLVKIEERRFVDLAAEVLADHRSEAGYTYSGFCMTSLPHRSIPDEQEWRRPGERFTLVIEPGALYDAEGNRSQLLGVPYGPKARLILLYLQSEAIRTGSQEVELGRSMNAWLDRMGISSGGTTYKAFREQATRLSTCRLVFVKPHDRDPRKTVNRRDQLVDGTIALQEGDSRQSSLWVETVRLSDTFWSELRKEPVVIWDGAVRVLAEKSHALDIYCWLAHRLHTLESPVDVDWKSLHAQFGASYKNLRQFKPRFIDSFNEALATYEDAKVVLEDRGLVLHPSRPPLRITAG